MSSRLITTTTKRKATDDISNIIPETPSPTPKSPIHEMVDKLFDDGIAHSQQWNFPAPNTIHDDDRHNILKILKERFSPTVSLIAQLPRRDPQDIHSAFYRIEENWFYQAFQQAGYDGNAVGRCLYRWMNGDVNTIVLCGDGLSIAKTVFNNIAACFPMSVVDRDINSFKTMARVAADAAIYCIPFVEQKPDPIMLHLMEGNSTRCPIDDKAVFIKNVPILIHCNDVQLAKSFVAKNTVLFFLGEHHSKLSNCYAPRYELRDFVLHASPSVCFMNVHCKRDNPMCKNCMAKPE